jgi:hypothetical protein
MFSNKQVIVKVFLLFTIINMLTLSCQLDLNHISLDEVPSSSIVVVNHSQPQLRINDTVFQEVGCPPNEYGTRICQHDSPLYELGCNWIRSVSNLVGGLDPDYPLAECIVDPYIEGDARQISQQILNERTYLYSLGCLAPIYVRYVVFRDDQFKLIKTEDDFRTIFAPITSKEEALGYVLAVTGYSAYYGLNVVPEYRYYVNQLEDTFVVEDDLGFRVHLYHDKICGCGPHTISRVNLYVGIDGHVQHLTTEPVYENPDTDDLCYD